VGLATRSTLRPVIRTRPIAVIHPINCVTMTPRNATNNIATVTAESSGAGCPRGRTIIVRELPAVINPLLRMRQNTAFVTIFETRS
jgi:hypothetical protein